MGRQEGWRVIRTVGITAGLQKRFYPHLIRHCFAAHLHEGGADLRVIQELLGHASLNTTQIYLKMDVSRLRKVFKDFHPRESASNFRQLDFDKLLI
jgi:integrase/recombinase XerD